MKRTRVTEGVVLNAESIDGEWTNLALSVGAMLRDSHGYLPQPSRITALETRTQVAVNI